MARILVTGASGFFGGILKQRLLADGHIVTNIDRIADPAQHPNLTSVQADIRDTGLMDELFASSRFDAVMHCAAILAHGSSLDQHDLWTSNVDGTRRIAEACQKHGVVRCVKTMNLAPSRCMAARSSLRSRC
jgi:UDP-glucose 4-epimerase